MKPPRLVREIGKRIVKATPILRRRFMYSSTDYRLLSGPEEARARARRHQADGLPRARCTGRSAPTKA